MDEHTPQDPAAPHRPPRRVRARRLTAVAAAGVLATVTLGGVALDRSVATPVPTGAGTAVAWGRHGGSSSDGSGFTGGVGTGQAGVTTGTTRAATATEQTGVVDITTVLDYGTGRAAGTGIVLTASGEILTNNHVVDEATAITVTVTATGTSYTATVVGTDPTDDIAVLQLSRASGLTTAPLASAAAVSGLAVGDAVTAVGNAEGAGGTPTAATGSVVALGRSITATDETGAGAEQLTGLIQVDAAVVPGDSGGPLSVDGAVVGIDTAASSTDNGPRTVDAASAGYAIPITTATAIADRIVAGEDSSTIHQGYPAFLGVQVTGSAADGAQISGIVSGSPAAAAGLAAGDTVTAVGATAIGDAATLSTALQAHVPGDRVRVTWTDAAGATHTATVTLAAGPAD